MKLGDEVISEEGRARQWRNQVHKQAQKPNSKFDLNPTNNNGIVPENSTSPVQEERDNASDDGHGGRE